MKDISPGPPCVPVENTTGSRAGRTVQVESRFWETDVAVTEGPPDCLLPIQKCCIATTEEISRSSGGEWSSEVQCSTAERGGV